MLCSVYFNNVKKLERQWTKEEVAGLITNGLSGRMAVKRQFINKGNWVRKRLKYATLDGLQRDNTVSIASLKQRIQCTSVTCLGMFIKLSLPSRKHLAFQTHMQVK